MIMRWLVCLLLLATSQAENLGKKLMDASGSDAYEAAAVLELLEAGSHKIFNLYLVYSPLWGFEFKKAMVAYLHAYIIWKFSRHASIYCGITFGNSDVCYTNKMTIAVDHFSCAGAPVNYQSAVGYDQYYKLVRQIMTLYCFDT